MPGIMGKKLRRWEFIGWVGVGLLGPLLHFAYGWSGENRIVAAFSTVNESIWEHMKILFWPLILLTAAELPVFVKHYRNFLAIKAVAISSALALVPVLYYTYAGVWGQTLAAVDIAIYYIAAAAAGGITCRLAGKGKLVGPWKQVLAGMLLGGVAALLIWFTYAPPAIGIFQEAMSCLQSW